jgi:hypothetical protein
MRVHLMRGRSIQSAELLDSGVLEVALCRACGAMCGDNGDSLCVPCWQRVPLYEKRSYMALWRRAQTDENVAPFLLPAMERLVKLARRKAVVA